jgi:hypothetical protein
VALRAEVVHLVGLDLLHHVDEARRIGEIAVVEHEAAVAGVRILVEVVDPVGVDERRPALDAVDDVSLVEQELGEVGAVLAGDAGDESDFGHGVANAMPSRSCGAGFARQTPWQRREHRRSRRLHAHDPVGHRKARRPVRDQEDGAARQCAARAFEEFDFALRIEHRRRLVEDQDRRILEQRARQRDTLLLPARQSHAPVADQRVVALRQVDDEVVRAGGARGGFDLRLRRLGRP